MATTAQVTANQANSKLSTGPLTPEGKARISQNAVRHGLTAKNFVVRDEEQEEFAAFQRDLVAQLHPQGAVETIVFDELLHASWNLQRFRRLEARISRGVPDDLLDPRTATALDRLTRYQARTQRAFYKALQELRTLQSERALREVKLHPECAARVPALTDFKKLTKQSQSAVNTQGLDHSPRIVDHETRVVRLTPALNRPTVIPEMTLPAA